MPTVGVVHQRLETDDTKGARLRRLLVRSVLLHLEDTGVAQCFVAESSLMGSSYIVGVAEAAGKVLQVEVLAAIGANRWQKVVQPVEGSPAVIDAITRKTSTLLSVEHK